MARINFSPAPVLTNVRRNLGAVFFLCLVSLLPAQAQTLDKEIAVLADKLSKVLVAKHKTKVAVTDFTDLQGRPTELGRFLSEQLTVELVNAPQMSVVDRANIKRILAEHKLTEEGLVNPANAKALGQFAGVDTILIGTVTSLDDSISLTVKAISTDTAELAAASRATFQKTREIQQLLVHGVGGGAISDSAASTKASAIAAKSLGDLNVSLLSIQSIRITNRYPNTNGLRCVFEFSNRNIKDPLVFAGNGQKPNPMDGRTVLRARITDSSGQVWEVEECRGLGIVRVGGDNSPSAIAEVLAYGQKVTPNGYSPPGSRIWLGDFSTLPEGESMQATIIFASPDSRRDEATSENEVQLECEFVVGLASQSKKFRLHTMIVNGIKISSRAQ